MFSGAFDKDIVLEQHAAANLKRVHRIVARESRTIEYLESIGVTDNVVFMPDPAFSLEPASSEIPTDLKNMLKAGTVGVNISPLLATYRPKPDRWIDEAADCVSAILTDLNMPVLLVPHVMEPGNDDADFLEKVRLRVKAQVENLLVLPSYQLSSRQLKYIISKLRCFIGARTHATIAALSSGVPTLSIGYSIKAQGINEDIFGHSEWVIDHNILTPKLLVEKVKKIIDLEDKIVKYLKNKLKTYHINNNDIKSFLS